MKNRITATKAARSFSELMNRAQYRGESFVVERGGRSICEIIPAGPANFTGAALVNLLRALPRPDEDYLKTIEEVTRNQAGVARSPWES